MQLGWIDFSKEDRQKALDVINLLSEQGTVDELGIGTVRDAFANCFFPGTSTVQTRAKYFFIVPYILKDAVDGRYGKDIDRILTEIDADEKDCAKRLLNSDSKVEGVIGSRVLPKGWVSRRPSDIYWNGIKRYGIFCYKDLSIREYISSAVKNENQKSAIKSAKYTYDEEENNNDDVDAGDIDSIKFWSLPSYGNDWRDNLTIDLTKEESEYLNIQIQKETRGSLLEYILKNKIVLDEYDSFESLRYALSDKVDAETSDMMKLACDFNNLIYMARVRYNLMLSEGENKDALSEWERLRNDIKYKAQVNLDEVFFKLKLINIRTKKFLCDIQSAFMTEDIDLADETIHKRELHLKGSARAKLMRTKEFDHSKWVGGKELDYRFFNARRIINDIYNWR